MSAHSERKNKSLSVLPVAPPCSTKNSSGQKKSNVWENRGLPGSVELFLWWIPAKSNPCLLLLLYHQDGIQTGDPLLHVHPIPTKSGTLWGSEYETQKNNEKFSNSLKKERNAFFKEKLSIWVLTPEINRHMSIYFCPARCWNLCFLSLFRKKRFQCWIWHELINLQKKFDTFLQSTLSTKNGKVWSSPETRFSSLEPSPIWILQA